MVGPFAEGLLKRIDGKRDELVELTRALVRIPTVNPPGENYRDCCEFLAARLDGRGFTIELLRAEGRPGDSERYPRWNLVARKEGRVGGPVVHFNSHVDVVVPGEGWTVAPFGGEIAEGRVYGRGAADMKGGLAASIVAVESFLEAFPNFPGAIEISATADEESGGFGGVAFLAEIGILARPRIDHVIIPEPLDKHRICLGHRGVWWAEIETKGRIAHGSMPFLGDSAVRHMGAVLEAFERDLYPVLETRQTEQPVVPEGARRSTLNVNSIHGGAPEGNGALPAPCVADSCRIVIDRRFLPEERLTEVKAELVGVLDGVARRCNSFRYEVRDLFDVEPTLTDRSAPVPQALAASIADVLGRPPDFVVSPGTYDQKHFARLGQIHDCVAYGPGILSLAHQPDEYVGIDDLVDSTKVMALALHRLLFG